MQVLLDTIQPADEHRSEGSAQPDPGRLSHGASRITAGQRGNVMDPFVKPVSRSRTRAALRPR